MSPAAFLAVLVVATPCPFLIAIPVAIIGSISLVRGAASSSKTLPFSENIDTCRPAIFDKTGTLTYGQPQLTEVVPAPGFTSNGSPEDIGQFRTIFPASIGALLSCRLRVEQPGLTLQEADEVSERPGEGLRG